MVIEDKIKLSEEQKLELAGAIAAHQEALARLGETFLVYDELQEKYSQQAERLEQSKKIVHAAKRMRDKSLDRITHELNLPPGDWELDLEAGAYIQKAKP